MDYRVGQDVCRDYERSSRLEWLLTNGLGGFAMGTVAGSNTRRYHGLLVAAVKPPTHRMVLLAGMELVVSGKGRSLGLTCNQYSGAVHPDGFRHLSSFEIGEHAEWVWTTPVGSVRKRVGMTWGENSTTIEVTNIGSDAIQVTLRPMISHKDYHGNFRAHEGYPEKICTKEHVTEIRHEGVSLFLHHHGLTRSPSAGWYYRFEHQVEIDRGLDPIDDLFVPIELVQVLLPGESVTLVASDSEASLPFAFRADTEPGSLETKLARGTRKLLIDAPNRTSIMAGYPWFTDWGRDTMISLPGMCLALNDIEPGKRILRAYAAQMRSGLLPNRFVDAGEEPDSNTVDATLWFANAINFLVDQDPTFADEALPWLEEVYGWHLNGTLFGIKVDQKDGLLNQGEEGVQLTWMDVKIGDWVVTPRTGKAVEINALWINLLRVVERLCRLVGKDPEEYVAAAEKAEASFDPTFWRDSIDCYLDVAQPDDGNLRPNFVLGISLPFSPMRGWRAEKALEMAKTHLLTPRGLRTLAPFEMGYKGRFDGDMKQRDAAYHQGTCWPWLLGPYVAAVLAVKGDVEHCRQIISEYEVMLEECGLGGIAEVYDGDEPQRPGGCPWQAWSIAEALRAALLVKAASA